MATHRISILGMDTLPDTSGNVWMEPAAITQTNDRFPQLVTRFKDTATKIAAGGKFLIPKNYVSSPKIYLYWTSTATSGNVVWGVATAVVRGDDTNSLDPSADTETATVTDAAPTASQRQLVVSMSLTAGNYAIDDLVQFSLSRDGTSGSDTMAADAVVYAAIFEYSDV